MQVIGVDDDAVFCDFAHPTLTSLSTNQVRKGEVAAMELNRLMHHARADRKAVVLRDAEIVARESTTPISPAAHLIERTLYCIARQATDGAITAACGFANADYAKRLFRKTYGLTMRNYRRTIRKSARGACPSSNAVSS